MWLQAWTSTSLRISVLRGWTEITEIRPGSFPTPHKTQWGQLFSFRDKAGQEIRVLFSTSICANYVRGEWWRDRMRRRGMEGMKECDGKSKYRYISQVCHRNGHGWAHTRWRAVQVKTGGGQKWRGAVMQNTWEWWDAVFTSKSFHHFWCVCVKKCSFFQRPTFNPVASSGSDT